MIATTLFLYFNMPVQQNVNNNPELASFLYLQTPPRPSRLLLLIGRKDNQSFLSETVSWGKHNHVMHHVFTVKKLSQIYSICTCGVCDHVCKGLNLVADSLTMNSSARCGVIIAKFMAGQCWPWNPHLLAWNTLLIIYFGRFGYYTTQISACYTYGYF